MMNDLIAAFCAFMIGLVISALNYAISRGGLKKNTNGNVALVSVTRQLLSVTYLLVLFFASDMLGCSRTYLLLGGALGLTLPMFGFSMMLIKQLENEKTDGKSKTENSVNKNETGEKGE